MRPLFLCIVLLASTTFAQDDWKLELMPFPPNPAPGDLIVIRSNAPDKTLVKWIGCSDKTFLPVNNNREIVFASGQPGRYKFFAVAYHKNQLLSAETEVTIGKPGPEPEPDPDDPDPEPDPNVPPDQFDNIGQKVHVWSNGLPKANEVGKVYLKYSAALQGGEYLSITDAAKELITERNKILGDDVDAWQEFGQRLNSDFSERWPMVRQLTAEYWEAIGKGLTHGK